MRSTGRFASLVLVALAGVLLGAVLVWTLRVRSPQPAAVGLAGSKGGRGQTPSAAAPSESPFALPAGVSEDSQDAITAAIARVGPAVVNINTQYQPVAQDRMRRPRRDVMGAPMDPLPPQGKGSGIIIDGEKGYVLTNAHVVRGATHIEVGLADGRLFEAELVGMDPLSDVAVVRLSGENLPSATLGSAADLPIGSWVIAIGNAFGFENSVTVGVVSAKDRQIEGPGGIVLQDLLQTDAAINRGNSGGALVDLNGEVVGIPTAMIPYAQGIGFAISVDVAKQVAERLMTTGKIPWLGVAHRDVTPDEARSLGLSKPQGSLIVRVFPGGPAALAGIRPGDVITAMGDRVVDSARAFGFAIRAHDAGEKIQVTIWREDKEITSSVTLGEVPS